MMDFFIIMKSELLITLIIFVLLFIKLGKNLSNTTLLTLIQVLLGINLLIGFIGNEYGQIFGTMYHSNPLIQLEKNILNLGLFLIAILFTDFFKKCEALIEYYVLMLSSVLGMFFMISSGNMLMFYLGLELSSIPVAALANFDLLKKTSSESALKMILSSAFSSALLLLGISFLYGATGSIDYSAIALLSPTAPLSILAFLLFISAFLFKLSVIPFHLWTADVYEGAPVVTTAFLSVLSKASIAFAFMILLYKVFPDMQAIWLQLLFVLALVTIIIGNLFAIRQENIKRFLAFSSIAQVGYILLGIASHTLSSTSAVLYFILIYTFSNLLLFSVVSIISCASQKENISDYNNLYQNNKMMSWMLALGFFSLAGIPPTAGFFGKLFLLTTASETGHYIFIILAALNMMVSLYYYLRVIRAVFIEKNTNPIAALPIARITLLAWILCAAAILVLGIFGTFYEYIHSITQNIA